MALRRGDIAAMEIIVRFDVFYGESLFPTRRFGMVGGLI